MALTGETENKTPKLYIGYPVQKKFPATRQVIIFSGIIDEVDLILSRAGVFRQPAKVGSMTICPLHRSKLGLGWIKGTNARCRVPALLSNHGKKEHNMAEMGQRNREK